MDYKLTSKFSDVKYARFDRRYVCDGHTAHRHAVRAYNRATRKAARQECRQAA